MTALGTVSSSALSASSTCSALLAGIAYPDRSCCSISAGTLARSLQADMQTELREIELAVGTATKAAGIGLKTELSRQVPSAGLGQRLANSWRDKHYPNQRLDAASLVYTNAPQIIRAFDEGAGERRKLRRGVTDQPANTYAAGASRPAAIFLLSLLAVAPTPLSPAKFWKRPASFVASRPKLCPSAGTEGARSASSRSTTTGA